MDSYIFFGFKPSCRDLHVAMYTFEGILGEKHKVEEDSECPYINWDSVIRVTNDFRCHVFFCPTVSFCSNSSNRTCKPKISDFISELISFFFEKNVFWFDISMYEVFLMDAFESFHDFNNDFDCLSKGENFAWQFSLVGEKISLFAVLHDDDDEIGGWVRSCVLVN